MSKDEKYPYPRPGDSLFNSVTTLNGIAMDHGHATSHELVSDHPFCLINANRNEKFNREATIVLILAGYSFWTMGLCLLYTSPSPRDLSTSRMPSSA